MENNTMEALTEPSCKVASLSGPCTEKARCELDEGYSPPAEDDSLAARFGAWGEGMCSLIGRWLAYNTADESACLASLAQDRVPALVEFIFELGIDFGPNAEGPADAAYDRAVIAKMVNKRLPAYYEGVAAEMAVWRDAQDQELASGAQENTEQEAQKDGMEEVVDVSSQEAGDVQEAGDFFSMRAAAAGLSLTSNPLGGNELATLVAPPRPPAGAPPPPTGGLRRLQQPPRHPQPEDGRLGHGDELLIGQRSSSDGAGAESSRRLNTSTGMKRRCLEERATGDPPAL